MWLLTVVWALAGCSSLLFPEVMGYAKANEMLLLGKQLTAAEAERCGFVAQVRVCTDNPRVARAMFRC